MINMKPSMLELRMAVHAIEGVACFRVSPLTANVQYEKASAYWAECKAAGQVRDGESFAYFAAENGWCVEPGWWWAEDESEEQRHGPFASERACRVHCLTWQHVLVNGQLGGHLPYGCVGMHRDGKYEVRNLLKGE